MLYQIFNSIREFLFKVFDNSTIAAIIGVIFGVGIGVWQYKNQKKIDLIEQQKQKVIDLLMLLKNSIEEVDFILRRILHTYKSIKGDSENLKRFLMILEKHEIPRLSNLINEKIPLIDKKIVIYLNAFFQDKNNLKKLHKDYKDKLKPWHDFIVNNYRQWITSITENEKIPSDLHTKEINDVIDKLIESIKSI